MWISAEEEYPPRNRPFIAFSKEGFQCICFWDDDIEEYRTLLDISRECRDGLRQIVLIRGYDDKIK